MNMKDRCVLVTGGASGLGLSTVEALAQAGAKIAIVDVNQQTLDRCVESLRAKKYDVQGYAGDIVPKAGAIALFEQAAKYFGRIDGLVNCAGVYPRRPILEITDEDW